MDQMQVEAPAAATAASSASSLSLKVASYNILAQGFTAPFANTPAADLAWVARRPRLVAALLALDADVMCLQEVQSSTRGWGRALTGKDLDGPDHAQQLRVLLAAKGYDGAYQNIDGDARSSDSAAKNDTAWSPATKRNAAWPCEDGPGARIGVALFWRRDVWRCAAQRPVLFSSLFMPLTKDIGDVRAWQLLKSWHCAVLCLLHHAASGALVLVIATHFPTPGSGPDDAVGNEAATANAAPKGVIQQTQFAEALVIEAASFLATLGLAQRVPIVIAGDFNSMPSASAAPEDLSGSPLYRLLTRGGLPATEPALSGLIAPKPGAASRKRRAPGAVATTVDGASAATVAGPSEASTEAVEAEEAAAPIALPFPAPNCGGGGAFTSAYVAVTGVEPPFTNFRLCYASEQLAAHRSAAVAAERAAAAAAAAAAAPAAGADAEVSVIAATAAAEARVAAAGLRDVPGETLFKATLDYIFFRNPTAGSTAGVMPRTTLRPVAVAATPSHAEVAAACGALPSALHPSDHVPIAALFEVDVEAAPAGGAVAR